MKNLLFISHNASRSGAPILLLNLIRWFVSNKSEDFKITLLVVNDGPLINEFKKLVNVKLFNNKSNTKFKYLNLFLNKINKKKIITDLSAVKWNLIFSNTIVNGKQIELFKNSSTPIVSYIHELEYSINSYKNSGMVDGTLLHTDFFICGSKMVRNNLIDTHRILPLKTGVINSFAELKFNSKNKKKAEEIKNGLSIPSDAMVVGMMGNLDWRKGSEFFVETASKLSSKNVFFIWIGANNQNRIDRINYDLQKSNKKVNIKFLPPTQEFSQYFNIIDLFFLCSREDPYPMVIIEATSYGIPLICFEKAGGTQEFIDEKVGFIVPYGDTEEAANKIQLYFDNRDMLVENSAYIKNKSIKHHDIDSNAPRILEIIEKLIQK